MTLTLHELKCGIKPLLIWTIAITGFMITCIFIYPEMENEMTDMSDMFSSMGAFTKAFGMDVLSFGTFKGYYAIECGNVIGIGGALFAALIGTSALSKEEAGHTAEFLFSHPISRVYVTYSKALSILIQLIFMNTVVFASCIISIMFIGEDILWKELTLLHLAYFLLQFEIASVCFLFSSKLNTNGYGLGLGFALALYFLNLIANITDDAKSLKYLTPFSFAEASDIMQNAEIELKYLLPGMCLGCVCLVLAFIVYKKKDLRI